MRKALSFSSTYGTKIRFKHFVISSFNICPYKNFKIFLLKKNYILAFKLKSLICKKFRKHTFNYGFINYVKRSLFIIIGFFPG